MNLPNPRPTSIAAWHGLLASDKLSKYAREVIRALYHNGPSTAKEIEFHSKRSGIWKRTSELRNTGFVIESGKRKCSITKEVVIEWCLPEIPPVLFETQLMFYEIRCVVCFKNRTWAPLKYYLSMRRRQSVKPTFELAIKAALNSVDHVKITKHTEIAKDVFAGMKKAEPHLIIQPVRESE